MPSQYSEPFPPTIEVFEMARAGTTAAQWTLTKTLRELKSLGTAQNRKTFTRHGVTGEQFGVSFANLGKLKKQIKVDQALAEGLWDSGNHDARVLAMMIADPSAMKTTQLDAWAKSVDNHVLAGQLSNLAARHKGAAARAAKWTKSRSELTSTAGWSVVASLARLEGEERPLGDEAIGEYVDRIEKEIHRAPNRTRYSMNGALISIGLGCPKLEKRALAAAKRIGTVEVDHGETNCKTPDAAEYIRKGRSAFGKKKKKK